MFENVMKNIVVGLLLLVSKSALGAIEAKITQADIDTCRALMLDDALNIFLSGNNVVYQQSSRRISCEDKSSPEKNCVRYRVALSNLGKEKFLLMKIVHNQAMIDASTPRGTLKSKHIKVHPVRCLCGRAQKSELWVSLWARFCWVECPGIIYC
jgi:hypothetical protein